MTKISLFFLFTYKINISYPPDFKTLLGKAIKCQRAEFPSKVIFDQVKAFFFIWQTFEIANTFKRAANNICDPDSWLIGFSFFCKFGSKSYCKSSLFVFEISYPERNAKRVKNPECFWRFLNTFLLSIFMKILSIKFTWIPFI